MQATVTSTLKIDAEPALVFEYLTDLKYHYLWNPQVRSISTKRRLKLGTTYQTESHILGQKIKALNTVTGYEDGKELTVENNTGTVHYKAKFCVDDEQAASRVKLSVTLSTDSKIWVFTVPVLKQLALRELRTDLEALKVAVENKLS